MGDAYPFERNADAVAGDRLAGGGQDLEVLSSGQMTVKPGLVDDRPYAGEGLGTVLGDGVTEQRHGPGVGVGQSKQDPDERRLAGSIRAEVAEGAAPGDEELDVVDGDVAAESFGQPAGLDSPVAPGAGGAQAVSERCRHRSVLPCSARVPA